MCATLPLLLKEVECDPTSLCALIRRARRDTTKAGDTSGDFIRPSRRSAKIARCVAGFRLLFV